jgi:N6-adenosine-specific RNA methylase IME4/ParB-like chromosome segregation protein Spo0J
VKIHAAANIFPPMAPSEYTALRADIAAHGLREPIWTKDGSIIDGRHRWRACEELKIAAITREYDGDDVAAFVVSLNLHRRHLDETQRSVVAAKLANLQHGQKKADTANAVTQSEAAALLNVSVDSVQRAAKVIDHGVPELVAAVQAGAVSVSAAADVATLPVQQQAEVVARGEAEILEAAKRIRAGRTAKTNERNAAIRREAASIPPPAGAYRTIVTDPPWPMEIIDRDVRPGQVGFHYPTMSIDEISAMQLPLADDATVFMWTTQRFLPDAFRVLAAWGLKYLVTMVWHKPGGPQPFNLPQYNCEFVLIGRRGSPVFLDTKAFPVCFQAPRREHSRKPDEFYALVSRVCAGPMIDMFSREKRDGFDQFGAETDKFAA